MPAPVASGPHRPPGFPVLPDPTEDGPVQRKDRLAGAPRAAAALRSRAGSLLGRALCVAGIAAAAWLTGSAAASAADAPAVPEAPAGVPAGSAVQDTGAGRIPAPPEEAAPDAPEAPEPPAAAPAAERPRPSQVLGALVPERPAPDRTGGPAPQRPEPVRTGERGPRADAPRPGGAVQATARSAAEAVGTAVGAVGDAGRQVQDAAPDRPETPAVPPSALPRTPHGLGQDLVSAVTGGLPGIKAPETAAPAPGEEGGRRDGAAPKPAGDREDGARPADRPAPVAAAPACAGTTAAAPQGAPGASGPERALRTAPPSAAPAEPGVQRAAAVGSAQQGAAAPLGIPGYPPSAVDLVPAGSRPAEAVRPGDPAPQDPAAEPSFSPD